MAIILRVQLPIIGHSWTSRLSPSHSSGREHVRVRVCIPPVHVSLQSVKSLHSDQTEKNIKDISIVLIWHLFGIFYVRKLLRFRFSLPGHKFVLHSTISFVSPHSSPPFSGSDSICLVLAVVPVPHDSVQALQLLHVVNLQSTKWRCWSKPYWNELWKWNDSLLIFCIWHIYATCY